MPTVPVYFCDVCKEWRDAQSLLRIQRLSGVENIMCESCINKYIVALGKMLERLENKVNQSSREVRRL